MNLQGLKYTLPHLFKLSKQITSPFSFQMQIQNTKSVKSLLIHTTTSTTNHQGCRKHKNGGAEPVKVSHNLPKSTFTFSNQVSILEYCQLCSCHCQRRWLPCESQRGLLVQHLQPLDIVKGGYNGGLLVAANNHCLISKFGKFGSHYCWQRSKRSCHWSL